MNKFLSTVIAVTLFMTPALYAQSTEPGCSLLETTKHLKYLASDKLLGRMTGEPGNDTAAAYIAAHFKSCGLQFLPGYASFFQKIEFIKLVQPRSGTLIIGNDTLKTPAKFVTLFATKQNNRVNAVYAGFGVVDTTNNRNDYKGLDVKGKYVVVKYGISDSTTLRQGYAWMQRKIMIAAQQGALGIIEIMTSGNPQVWGMMSQGSGRPQLAETFDPNSQSISSFLVSDFDKKILNTIEKNPTPTITIVNEGTNIVRLMSQNVVGVLPGADAKLNKEYVMLSAHFDHIGTGSRPGTQDTINNGARDNGMGTTALLGAAKAFSTKKTARSIIFAAWTGEEVGLLGSQYYTNHPGVPHNTVIYNLNTDGAGFNDTTLITVIGLERTSAEKYIQQAAQTQGLKAASDPSPEQGLFDRSDNVNFAKNGIPAPTLAPGFKAFDAELYKYYHQPGDEAGDDFNFRYLTKYVNTFVGAARLIANAPERPRWKVGDKYEPAFKKLYNEK